MIPISILIGCRFWPVQSAASIGSEKSNAFDSCSCPSIGAERQSAGSRCRLSCPSPVWRPIPTSRRLVRSVATYDRPATQSPKLPPIVPPIVPKSPSGYGPLVLVPSTKSGMICVLPCAFKFLAFIYFT